MEYWKPTASKSKVSIDRVRPVRILMVVKCREKSKKGARGCWTAGPDRSKPSRLARAQASRVTHAVILRNDKREGSCYGTLSTFHRFSGLLVRELTSTQTRPMLWNKIAVKR
jgi:hypothetical protein